MKYKMKLLKNAVKNYPAYINGEDAMGNDNYNMAKFGTDNEHFKLVSSIKCHLFGLLGSRYPKISEVIKYCDQNLVDLQK